MTVEDARYCIERLKQLNADARHVCDAINDILPMRFRYIEGGKTYIILNQIGHKCNNPFICVFDESFDWSDGASGGPMTKAMPALDLLEKLASGVAVEV